MWLFKQNYFRGWTLHTSSVWVAASSLTLVSPTRCIQSTYCERNGRTCDGLSVTLHSVGYSLRLRYKLQDELTVVSYRPSICPCLTTSLNPNKKQIIVHNVVNTDMYNSHARCMCFRLCSIQTTCCNTHTAQRRVKGEA